MLLSPGVRLGSYEIESAVGAGGMGEVYKRAIPDSAVYVFMRAASQRNIYRVPVP